MDLAQIVDEACERSVRTDQCFVGLAGLATDVVASATCSFSLLAAWVEAKICTFSGSCTYFTHPSGFALARRVWVPIFDSGPCGVIP